MRIRDFGINTGTGKPGPLNKITDVPGVTVGHSTVVNEKHQTGVTVVMPCPDNPFTNKLTAASYVLNGFGKTAGLIQIDELGTLESPIALTNTLNVGRVHDAMVGYMIDRCNAEGVRLSSFNPVICECNDASLNMIQERAVGEDNLHEAIASACVDFEEGAVGGGRGMTCHGLKGGIGSASRVLEFDGREYTVGILVQTNYGSLADLVIDNDPVGARIEKKLREDLPDKGSCIVILATDLPLSDRQLRRTLHRCPAGMARLGNRIGHGSGEVFIGFSTSNRHPSGEKRSIIPSLEFREDALSSVFRMASECTEEAVLNSLAAAETVTGYSGKIRHSLTEYLGKI